MGRMKERFYEEGEGLKLVYESLFMTLLNFSCKMGIITNFEGKKHKGPFLKNNLKTKNTF